ncbi:hypothetical protein QBC34DRAFT_428117 [Podospora aff. communis PSN243]|uniref:Ankyrin n=1 Tax=Podospora aff. communis PSN243 TaxID=3040156 RepID=A0AAV9GDN9_9PEZI|nr:hypothetical protein QBC34DRAFT_428117 [Podospora aff. communis PSN243]
MNPFQRFPPEICFARVMRLRLVSRQFRDYTYDAIFRLRLLNHFDVAFVGGLHRPIEGWRNYVVSYVAYQAKRERRTTSHAGRIYRAAQALCEEDGNATEEAVATCVRALCPLAMLCHPSILRRAPDMKLHAPTECELQHDIDVAAIYLSRMAHVERLVAKKGLAFVQNLAGSAFGGAFMAAVGSGNVEMANLVLQRKPKQDGTPGRPDEFELCYLLAFAASYGHRHLFDFAVDSLLNAAEFHSLSDLIFVLEHGLSTPCPDIYERLVALLGRLSHGPEWPVSLLGRLSHGTEPGRDYSRRLAMSIHDREFDLARHCLGKVVAANDNSDLGKEAFQRVIQHALCRAVHVGSEEMMTLLLNTGVELSQQDLSRLLRCAVWKGRIPIARNLLNLGADPNHEQPAIIAIAILKEHMPMFRLLREHGARLDTLETGGWAMAAAQQHGLDSMVDLLIREGADKDVVVDQPAGGFELQLSSSTARFDWGFYLGIY